MPLIMTSLPQEPKPFLDTKKHHNQPPKRKGKHEKRHHDPEKKKKKKKKKKPSSSSSWDQFKNLLITCKQTEAGSERRVHDPSKIRPENPVPRLGSSCSSICSFRDVVHGNTRVVHRADSNNSPDVTIKPHDRVAVTSGRGSSTLDHHGGSISSASRAMHFRKLSGCYECRMVVDPTSRRYPHIPRASICACSKCGEVFPNMESLELHQAVRHAVSELGPEDSGRNIVEIIFKSSWLKKDSPICKIQRILKVHNSPKTIQRFEECRDAVKTRALASTRKNPRCAADGNELLRFHCTTLDCSLGDGGSTSLCGSIPSCGVCAVIRHGFQGKPGIGIRTTASSGRAHDSLQCSDGRRAMLVCRVIAGRVKRMAPETVEGTATAEEGAVKGGAYDSVAGYGGSGAYSNLEELFVLNARAILPCFVVIYKALESY